MFLSKSYKGIKKVLLGIGLKQFVFISDQQTSLIENNNGFSPVMAFLYIEKTRFPAHRTPICVKYEKGRSGGSSSLIHVLKREKRGKWRGIALCNDEKGDSNGIVSLLMELTNIIYSNSIIFMEEERKKLRVIHVFDNVEDAANEMFRNIDGTTKKSSVHCMVGEEQFLINVAYTVYLYLLHYEAGLISKAELDLFLRTKPLPAKTLVNVSPVEFNFVFRSSINKRFYTNREYYLEDLDLEDAYSAIMESYDELSNMYSFDIIIEQMQKMVTEFKAAHRDFDKMTMDERITKFRSWNGNEDYINNNFLVSLLDKCRKDTRE